MRRILVKLAWGEDYPRRARLVIGLVMLALVVLMELSVSLEFAQQQERIVTWVLEGLITLRGAVLVLGALHDWHWPAHE